MKRLIIAGALILTCFTVSASESVDSLLGDLSYGAAHKSTQAASDDSQYLIQIRNYISFHLYNWKQYAGTGKECHINLYTHSDGVIDDVKVISGDADMCSDMEQQIIKMERIPKAPSEEIYQKHIPIRLDIGFS